MGSSQSGLSTTVTALMATAGYSGKTLSYRLCNPNAVNYLRGVGDQVVAKWECVLHALGGEMILHPLPGTGSDPIVILLRKATTKALKERNEALSKLKDYDEIQDEVIGGMSVPLTRESITLQYLAQATSEIATRRSFVDHHVMAISGEAHKSALSLIPGSGPAGLLFYQNAIELLGYTITITCDGLTITIARPLLPSEEQVQEFRRDFLRKQQLYAKESQKRKLEAAAKKRQEAAVAKQQARTRTKGTKEKAADSSVGEPEAGNRTPSNRSPIPPEELEKMLRASEDWTSLSAETGVTRQAIYAFAARHKILAPRERVQLASKRNASRKLKLRALKAPPTSA